MSQLNLIRYKINNEQKEFRLVKEIQRKWEIMGIHLGVSDKFANYEKPEEKCLGVLREWLQNGSEQYPVKWDSLIRLLQDIELREIANNLRKALDNIIE